MSSVYERLAMLTPGQRELLLRRLGQPFAAPSATPAAKPTVAPFAEWTLPPADRLTAGFRDDASSSAAANEETPPAGAGGVQERLAKIWADLLGVRPRPGDDFFLLGGHSLLATQLMARVQAEFGVELELHHVFQARDLASLAAGIESLAAPTPDALTYEEAVSLL